MSQSLAAIYLHVVFSTKHRQRFLADADFRADLHAYLGGISNRLDSRPIAIGGPDDHVHVLVRLSRTIAVAAWIKEIKRVSSLFAKHKEPNFSWQGGYGAFSVDQTSMSGVITYIKNQEEHHKRISFQDEFRQLLREHELEWDERYVWD